MKFAINMSNYSKAMKIVRELTSPPGRFKVVEQYDKRYVVMESIETSMDWEFLINEFGDSAIVSKRELERKYGI